MFETRPHDVRELLKPAEIPEPFSIQTRAFGFSSRPNLLDARSRDERSRACATEYPATGTPSGAVGDTS